MNADNQIASLKRDVESYLEHLARVRRYSHGTNETYRRALNHFVGFVGNDGMGEYRTPSGEELAKYLEHMAAQNWADSTRSLNLTAMRQFYRYLVLTGRTSSEAIRPVEALKHPTKWKRLPAVFTVEQGLKMIEAAKTDKGKYKLRDVAILETLWSTACRASELCDLELKNLDRDSGSAQIIGKGGKPRTVLLGEPALQALAAYLDFLRPRMVMGFPCAPWLFVSRAGMQLSREMLWNITKQYARKAQLPVVVSPHVFRHSAATAMLQAGAPMRQVSEILGHADIHDTARYLHLDIKDLRSLHERLVDTIDAIRQRAPAKRHEQLEGEQAEEGGKRAIQVNIFLPQKLATYYHCARSMVNFSALCRDAILTKLQEIREQLGEDIWEKLQCLGHRDDQPFPSD